MMKLLSKIRLLLVPLLLAGALSGSAFAGSTALVWKPLTLLNGWTTYYRDPAIAVDAQGVIHFRGSIYQATGTNQQIFTLPPAYRPSFSYIYLTVDTVDSSTNRIYFGTDGKVYADAVTYSDIQDFLSLEGVSYTK